MHSELTILLQSVVAVLACCRWSCSDVWASGLEFTIFGTMVYLWHSMVRYSCQSLIILCLFNLQCSCSVKYQLKTNLPVVAKNMTNYGRELSGLKICVHCRSAADSSIIAINTVHVCEHWVAPINLFGFLLLKAKTECVVLLYDLNAEKSSFHAE